MSSDPNPRVRSASDAGSGAPQPLPAGDFVGRADQLDRLDHALRAAVDGQQGQIALVSGEAGIGKTRLLDELASRARHLDATVLWGVCDEAESGGAYELFRRALDAFVRDAAEPELQAALGAQAAVLARLVPRLHERLPDLPQPVSLQPDEERTRLFDALSQALLGIAKQAPLVLVLDDLHWADADTVALLRHVVRLVPQQPHLLLVGAYRSAEVAEEAPLAETLALVQRLPRVETLRLQGLASEAVAELLCALPATHEQPAGLSAIDPALVEAVRGQTGGNPFFVRALARQLVEEGVLVCADGRWQLTRALDDLALPESVRQVLRRQLRRLTPEAQRWLTAAAGIGQAFRFDVAAAVAELDEERALAVVDEALAARLIQAGGAPDTYAFVHALVRQTFYEQLNPSRQVRLHRRIAEGMERIHAARGLEHAAEIAAHYHRSRSLPGAERGVEYALAAADHAKRSGAFSETAAYLRVALDVMRMGDARRPRVLSRLGFSLALAHDGDGALAAARDSALLLEQTEGRAAVARYLADLLDPLFESGSHPAAFEVARIGLRYVDDRCDAAWASCSAVAVIERECADEHSPGISVHSPEREEIGRVLARLTTTPSYAWTFLRRDRNSRDVGAAVFWRGEYRSSLPWFYDWAAHVMKLGLIVPALDAWSTIARCHTALGELARAREALHCAKGLAERVPGPSQAKTMLVAARDDFRAIVDEGWGQRIDVPRLPRRHLLPWYRASTDGAYARLHARSGRVEPALRSFRALVPAIEQAPGWEENYTRIVDNAVETLWLLRSTEHLETIERHLREKVIAPDFRNPMMDGRLALARLCALARRHEEAAEWFAKARAVLEEQGARPLRAIADYDEALMYARRGEAGDRERSLPLLDAALAQFRAIGMPGWIRRAEHLRTKGTEWSAASIAAAAAQPDSTPVVGPAPEAIAAAPLRSLFRLDGEFWTIAYGAKTFRLKHARGLTFLAALLRAPGREIAATELAARSEGNGGGTAALGNDAATRRSLGDAGELLDAQARASYRARVAELRAELAEAERFNDRGRAEGLRAELEALSAELARAVGLGGRERRAGAHAERARVNVTRAIALALAKIDDSDAALGEHLRRTIRTGTLYCYAPDPRLPIEWEA